MSSSKLRNIPPPPGSKAAASSYTRFIPREEMRGFAAWAPGDLNGAPPRETGLRKPEAEPPPRDPEAELREQLQAARQGGYQDGYRDGLAALEQFKQSFAQQVSAQLGTLVDALGGQFDALQHDMARTLASCATSLARQVVRSELALRPELVAGVAEESVKALLLSARHVTVRVHPDDHALVAQGAGDTLEARGARLVADASVTRGGCSVESDIGHVDGSIEARWARAAGVLGDESAWAPKEPNP